MNIVQKDYIAIRHINDGAVSANGYLGVLRTETPFVIARTEYPEFATFSKAILHLTVMTITGSATPTMNIGIEERDPLSNTWHVLDNFAAIIATGYSRKLLVDFAEELRFYATLTGTSPAFTFYLGAHMITV